MGKCGMAGSAVVNHWRIHSDINRIDALPSSVLKPQAQN
mgnify:CR=1 FL=1